MTDYITDREIERLALGELDETEANELMKRLEERGEIDRLEAIIADDEAFLEAHPPALIASQVRAEVRRRTRENATQEPRMINPSRTRFATGIAAGFAAAAVLFAIIYVQFVEPTEPAPRQATMTNETQTNTAAPAPTPTRPPPPEAEEEAQPERQVLSHRGTKFAMPSTLYMSVGEELEASALGVTKVTFSSTSVIDAAINEDRKSLSFTAKAAGQSLIGLTATKNGQSDIRSALVIVGEPISDKVIRRLVDGDYGEGDPSLLECSDHTDKIVTLRIVAQVGSTFVGHAHAEGEELSPQLRRCIDGVVGRWRIGFLVEPASIAEDEGQYAPGPKELSVGTLRFNFGKGAMCEPDHDDC